MFKVALFSRTSCMNCYNDAVLSFCRLQLYANRWRQVTYMSESLNHSIQNTDSFRMKASGCIQNHILLSRYLL